MRGGRSFSHLAQETTGNRFLHLVPPSVCLQATPWCIRDSKETIKYNLYFGGAWGIGLLAPYCAIPRDYLSDTPSPFSERFPLGEHAKSRCDTPPPHRRGISAILARYHMKTRQMAARSPSAIQSRKGIARYGGGISHWAAKGIGGKRGNCFFGWWETPMTINFWNFCKF